MERKMERKRNLLTKLAAVAASAVLLAASPAFAVIGGESVNPPKPDTPAIVPYNFAIGVTSETLNLSSGGLLTATGATDVRDGYYAGAVMELQRYSGGSWNTIRTWSDTEYSNVKLTEYYSASSGYSYRLKVTHKAYNSSMVQIEAITKYSNVVSY